LLLILHDGALSWSTMIAGWLLSMVLRVRVHGDEKNGLRDALAGGQQRSRSDVGRVRAGGRVCGRACVRARSWTGR
jgi:hypothetical protein